MPPSLIYRHRYNGGMTRHGAARHQPGDETMYTITYTNHDNGATGGEIIRDTQAAADRTAKLMGDCGYQTVTITKN